MKILKKLANKKLIQQKYEHKSAELANIKSRIFDCITSTSSIKQAYYNIEEPININTDFEENDRIFKELLPIALEKHNELKKFYIENGSYLEKPMQSSSILRQILHHIEKNENQIRVLNAKHNSKDLLIALHYLTGMKIYLNNFWKINYENKTIILF